MILFKDFFPEIAKKSFFTQKFEPLRVALRRANAWIEHEGIDVVNIETVVLPNLHDHGEEGTEDASLSTSGEMTSTWHQFIRVWYRHDEVDGEVALGEE